MIRRQARGVYSQYVRGTGFEPNLTLDELVHAGVVGWLEANKRHIDSNTVNPVFFIKNVRGRMLDLVRKQALVKMPQEPYAKVKQLMAAKKKLAHNGETITSQRLAAELNWQIEEVETLLRTIPKVFSADTVAGQRENNHDFWEKHTEKRTKPKQLDSLLKKEIADLIDYCLKQLENSRQRLIVTARYLQETSLKELALLFDCTEQAIHYQERQGLGKMRSCLDDNGWQWEGDEDNFL